MGGLGQRSSVSAAGPAPAPPKITPSVTEVEPLHEPPYHVILLDDDDHTHSYVIGMLREIFGHSIEDALRMAVEVDETGRAIVATCHKELAELRKEQIETFGSDPDDRHNEGSMRAIIEPAA